MLHMCGTCTCTCTHIGVERPIDGVAEVLFARGLVVVQPVFNLPRDDTGCYGYIPIGRYGVYWRCVNSYVCYILLLLCDSLCDMQPADTPQTDISDGYYMS